MRESIIPRKGKERFELMTTFTISILVVFDIITSPMPTYIFKFGLFLWIYDNLHAHLIKVINFVLIQNFKLDFMIFKGIGNLKEEPLRVPIRVDIILKKKVILILSDFGSHG